MTGRLAVGRRLLAAASTKVERRRRERRKSVLSPIYILELQGLVLRPQTSVLYLFIRGK